MIAASGCTPRVGHQAGRFELQQDLDWEASRDIVPFGDLAVADGLARPVVGGEFLTRDRGVYVRSVDVHSLRRTFATNLMVNRTDPKTVQALIGLARREMTVWLYAKMNMGTKRQAVGRLSYGRGMGTPEHIMEFKVGRWSQAAHNGANRPT